MAGRRLKLTPKLQDRIVGLIELGNYDYVAAQAAGIGKSTFYRWLERGEKAQSGIYREFWEAVTAAQAKAEVVNLGRIMKAAANGSTQDARWFLERKAPDRWGNRQFRGTLDKDGKPTDPQPAESRVLVVPAEVDDIHEWSKRAKSSMKKTQAIPDDEPSPADVS
jgi:DNA invertase Pin-like site-specific DNA recombinase